MSTASTFKARLLAREPLLGCFVKTPHPVIVEALAAGGALDCVCLDGEHSPWDRRDLDACLLAARAGGLPAVVRVPSGAPHEILDALDLGAAGVLVPHVRSPAEAAAVARAAHYGPGGRGYSGGIRATDYGAPPMAERLALARAETTVIVQIEDVEALPHAEAIARTEGIDAVFIGRIDLTVAMGETDPKATRVMDAVSDVLGRCLAQGRAVGMFTPDLSEVRNWAAQGASLFLLGSDLGCLAAGAAKLRNDAGL